MYRMLKPAILVAGLLIITLPACAQHLRDAEPVGREAAGRYHALLIGIDEYSNPGLDDLDHPIADARRLRDVLLARYTFAPENVTLLENADEDAILDAFANLAGDVGPDDNLLIFYAGHGYWDAAAEQGYWLPSDARQGSRSRWISNSTIGDEISRIDSRHTLLISDACFAGSLLITRSVNDGNDEALDELHRLKSRKAMTSGALTEVPDKSVFMEELVGALDRNTSQRISARQLFSSFELRLIDNGPVIGGERLHPLYGEIKDAGDMRGEFLFVSSQAAPLPAETQGGSTQIVARSNWPGRLLVDSEEKAEMTAGAIETVELQPGSHVLQYVPQEPFKKADSVVVIQQGYSEVVEFTFGEDDFLPSWINSIDMQLQLIPAGSFRMGSEEGERDEKPVRTVQITRPFYMASTEVTQAQYEAVMGTNPSTTKDADLPVTNVSWENAQDFLRRLNERKKCTGCYRLPTEAEWEYACLAGGSGKYGHGDGEGRLSRYAWYGEGYNGSAYPVRSKEASAYGLYDMSGNVWEWVSDYYDLSYYGSGENTDPVGPPEGASRVLRGGSLWDSADYARCAVRDRSLPVDRGSSVGFRVVFSLP